MVWPQGWSVEKIKLNGTMVRSTRVCMAQQLRTKLAVARCAAVCASHSRASTTDQQRMCAAAARMRVHHKPEPLPPPPCSPSWQTHVPYMVGDACYAMVLKDSKFNSWHLYE